MGKFISSCVFYIQKVIVYLAVAPTLVPFIIWYGWKDGKDEYTRWISR